MDVCIIGIGNELRGDDGVGPALAARLQDGPLCGIAAVYNLGSDAFAVPGLVKEHRLNVIIDSLPPGPEPGKVRIIPWQARFMNAKNALSLHDLDLLWQLQTVKGNGAKVWLAGIETASMSWGVGLSPLLIQNFALIVDDLTTKIRRLIEGENDAPSSCHVIRGKDRMAVL